MAPEGIIVPPIPILTVMPGGQEGVAYSQAFSAVGGLGPYTFSISPGSGPAAPDMTMSSAGVWSGTAPPEGVYDIYVQVTDAYGRVGITKFTWTAAAP